MANKASGQVTLVDITDAYSVLLTSESYTFVGDTTGAPSGLSCTTQVVAYCGTQQCSKVSVSTITCPVGISATISNNNTSSPTVTFKTTATITEACEAIIPVVVDGVTINKKFSFAVAKQGNVGKSIATLTTNYSYTQSDIDRYSANGYSGTWACSDTSGIKVDDTILLRITNTSKNGYSFVIAKVTAIPSSTSITCTSLGLLDKGDTGDKGSTGKGISSVTPQYYISTSKTSTTGGSWSDTAPTTIEKGKYLWTRMKVVYTNPSSTEYTTATYDSMTDSRIEQLKDSITLSVTDGTVGNTAKIKLGIDNETREANIDLTGAVSFSDLSTAGKTTINGSNITTGTLSADRINVEDLMAQHLTSTGGLSVTGDFELQNGWASISKYSDAEYDGWLQISASGITGLGQQDGLIRLRQGYVYIDTTGQGAIGSAGIKVGGGSVRIQANKVVSIDAPTVEIGNSTSDSTTGSVTIHEPVKIYKNSSSIVSLSDYILSVVDGTWEESY